MIDPVALLIEYHAALQARDYSAIEGCLHRDAVYVSAGLGALDGRPNILSALQDYFSKHLDHVANDEKVEKVSASCAKSTWCLKANKVERRGVEYITFNPQGLITKVEVQDA